MNRHISALLLGAIALVAAGCAATPAASPNPTDTGTSIKTPSKDDGTTDPGGREESGGCKTPEGASASAPATCQPECVWNTKEAKCVPGTRGILIPE